MTTIGHVFIPLNREHDGTVPTDDDQAHFESLPVPLAVWEPFEQCLSKHLWDLTEGQIDREEKFWFEAAHVNAMIAVVEAEAITAGPELRNWLISLAALARRAVDRHVGVVFCRLLNAQRRIAGYILCAGLPPPPSNVAKSEKCWCGERYRPWQVRTNHAVKNALDRGSVPAMRQ